MDIETSYLHLVALKLGREGGFPTSTTTTIRYFFLVFSVFVTPKNDNGLKRKRKYIPYQEKCCNKTKTNHQHHHHDFSLQPDTVFPYNNIKFNKNRYFLLALNTRYCYFNFATSSRTFHINSVSFSRRMTKR